MKFHQLFILTLLLVSCKNKENDYLEVIKQNNLFLQEEINIYNARHKIRSYELPNIYDTITFEKMNNLLDEINLFKKYSEYELINFKINKIAKDEKLNIKLNSITESDENVLKNNLLLNLIALNKQYINKKSNTIYDITYTPYIKKTTKNDTLILNFLYHNSYVIKTDSIIDGNDRIINFQNNNNCRIWQVKYKPKSNKSTYYGKIFEVDSDGNTYLVKNIKHSITK